MAYISSANITVFPSTRRASTYTEARLMSEQALVGIINNLIDSTGFVITTTYSSSAPFEFNIRGYYFKVATGAALVSTAASTDSKIYANIELVKTNNLVELKGEDDSTEGYTGVTFSSSASSGTNIYSLLLLQKAGDTWEIPESSLMKFNTTSMGITRDVNGGTF